MIIFKDGGQITTFFDRFRCDRPANLCQLFWYTLGISLVLTGLGVAAGLYVMGFVMIFIAFHPTTIWFIMASLFASIIGALIYHDRVGIPNPKGLVRQQWRENISTAYDAFTKKFCPLVSYKETV